MSATPQDQLAAQAAYKALDLAEEELKLLPGSYDNARIMLMYMARHGEENAAKALRWHELRQMGIPDEDAYAKVQEEFPG